MPRLHPPVAAAGHGVPVRIVGRLQDGQAVLRVEGAVLACKGRVQQIVRQMPAHSLQMHAKRARLTLSKKLSWKHISAKIQTARPMGPLFIACNLSSLGGGGGEAAACRPWGSNTAQSYSIFFYTLSLSHNLSFSVSLFAYMRT